MADLPPWDEIDLTRVFDVCREHGVAMPLDAAIAIALGVMNGIEQGNRIEDGTWKREVHGRIQASLVRMTATGRVFLDTPGPLSGDLPLELRFVAPEVASGNAPTSSSDVFSVGSLLFEMATGQPVLTGIGPLEVARQLESFDPVVLLHPHRPVLGALAPPLERALSPDPHIRYPTTDLFAEELQPIARERGANAEAISRFLETAFRSRACAEFDSESSLPGVAEAFDTMGLDEGREALETAGSDDLPFASDVVLDEEESPLAPWELQDDPVLSALGMVLHGDEDEDEEERADGGNEAPPWPEAVGEEPGSGAGAPPAEPSPWEPSDDSRTSGDSRGSASDDQDEEARISQVRGGAFLFADGRCVGPLPLLEMDHELARVRDPAALVAFEAGKWRPLHASVSLDWRPPTGRRLSFGLLELGPLLLEHGSGSRLVRLALWSGESAAMLELGQGRIWRAASQDVEPMLRQMVLHEDLLPTDSLPGDEVVAHDEDMLRWLEGRRLLDPGQAARLRKQILRRAASAPFAWERGEAMVQELGPCPTGEAGTVDLKEAIAFAVRDRRTQPVVEGVLYRQRERDVVVVEEVRARHADLPLTPAEASFVAQIPGRLPVTDALVGGWHQGREGSFAMLFLCIELGIVKLE